MSHALLALLVAAASQTPDAGTPAPPTPPQTQPAQPPAGDVPAETVEELRREVDQKVENAKQAILAELATHGLAESGEETWVEERRKRELFTLDGYFRTRPTLYHLFDLGRPEDPAVYTL